MHESNAQFVDLLVKSGWNQARAARELGVTTASVSRYVSGKMAPSLPVLRLFADRLQLPLTIYGGMEEGIRANDGPRWLTDWEEEVLATLRRIPSDFRPMAVKAIKDLTEACAQISAKAPRKPKAQEASLAVSLSESIAEATAASLIATQAAPDPSEGPLSSTGVPSAVPATSLPATGAHRSKSKQRSSQGT